MRPGEHLKRENRTFFPLRLEDHPFWKGDEATAESKRMRCRRMYPEIEKCQRCGRKASDRHHKDGDTGNNRRDNLFFLCRRCHMELDGRLARFISYSNSLKGPQPPKQCKNCKRWIKPIRKGRCHACNEYHRRRGKERPYFNDGRREKVKRVS